MWSTRAWCRTPAGRTAVRAPPASASTRTRCPPPSAGTGSNCGIGGACAPACRVRVSPTIEPARRWRVRASARPRRTSAARAVLPRGARAQARSPLTRASSFPLCGGKLDARVARSGRRLELAQREVGALGVADHDQALPRDVEGLRQDLRAELGRAGGGRVGVRDAEGDGPAGLLVALDRVEPGDAVAEAVGGAAG